MYRPTPVFVRVPATTANLGPGFDALGLALTRYDEVEVALTASGLHIDVTGEACGEVPREESHLVVRAMRAAFDLLGGQPAGLRVRCANDIPHGRGLGSSAAAVVAGILGARGLHPEGAQLLPDADVLQLATRFEGHPDNVAPCLFGGLTIAWTEDGRTCATRLTPHQAVRPVVFLPVSTQATHVARGLLPAAVPHADAARNAGRAALLVHALTSAPDLLLPATADWLHQPYRAPAMPASAELIAALRAAGIAAMVSGAGPSVLALPVGPSLLGELAGFAPAGWVVLSLAVDQLGAQVTAGPG